MSTEAQRMIQELRKNPKITRYKIARGCGVSWRTVVLWESGEIKNPMDERLFSLRNFYKENVK